MRRGFSHFGSFTDRNIEKWSGVQQIHHVQSHRYFVVVDVCVSVVCVWGKCYHNCRTNIRSQQSNLNNSVLMAMKGIKIPRINRFLPGFYLTSSPFSFLSHSHSISLSVCYCTLLSRWLLVTLCTFEASRQFSDAPHIWCACVAYSTG